MNVEIKGIGLPNKGAELMLIAVMEAFSARFGKVNFVVEPQVDFSQRSEYPLYQKVWWLKYGVQWGRLGFLVSRKIRKKYGLILDSEIDVIVDASGFAYGDFWGEKKLRRRLGDYVKNWKRRGKKVILLPQAFGPFSNSRLSRQMKTVLKFSDAVFARDRESYDCLESLAVSEANLHLSSDITSLVSGDYAKEIKPGTVAVVPNSKMVSKKLSRRDYIVGMVGIISEFHRQGQYPVLVVHEGRDDEQLARDIAKQLKFDIEIEASLNALEIKGYFGKCDVVVSSRFHGLVSALSQGVPVLATSWSHKYKELLSYYDCDQFLVELPISMPESVQFPQVDTLCNTRERDRLRATILKNAERNKGDTKKMWASVFEILES